MAVEVEGTRVLVFHPERFWRDGIRAALERGGFESQTAADLGEAFELLDAGTPVALLAGSEARGAAVPRLLAHRPGLRLILLDGGRERALVRRALRAGAWEVLEAPLHADALLRSVARAAAAPEAPAAAAAAPGWAEPAGQAERDAELARLACDAATQEAEPTTMLANVLRAVAPLLGAAPAAIYLCHESGPDLIRQAQWDAGGRGDRGSLPLGRGLTGTVFTTGRLVATSRPQADPRFDAGVDTPLDGAIAPLLCVPLRVRGRVVGVFRAFGRAGDEPAASSGEVLAAALSAAVRSALLYRSLLDAIDRAGPRETGPRP